MSGEKQGENFNKRFTKAFFIQIVALICCGLGMFYCSKIVGNPKQYFNVSQEALEKISSLGAFVFLILLVVALVAFFLPGFVERRHNDNHG